MSRAIATRNQEEGEEEDNRLANMFGGIILAAVGAAGAAYVGYQLYQLARDQRMSPARMHFSQNTIKSTFQNGQSVNDLILAIAAKKKKVEDIPNIKVLEDNGTYVSRDNRRLYVFRVLNLMGILPVIDVKIVGKGRESTSTSDGCHLALRQGITLQHCICHHFSGLPEWWDSTRRQIRYDLLSQYQRKALATTTVSANEDACIVM